MEKIDVCDGEWCRFPFEDLKGLPMRQQIVMAWLIRHRNKITGRCDPSISLLCKETCMGKTTMHKTLKELEKRKLIKINKRDHRTNFYKLAYQFNDPPVNTDQNMNYKPVQNMNSKQMNRNSYLLKSSKKTIKASRIL